MRFIPQSPILSFLTHFFLTFSYQNDNIKNKEGKALEIINLTELHKFSRRHPNARKALGNWVDATVAASWKNLIGLRGTFRSADYVRGLMIFDIGGNKYRLIATVDYKAQQVYVLEVMTHAEYNRWRL